MAHPTKLQTELQKAKELAKKYDEEVRRLTQKQKIDAIVGEWELIGSIRAEIEEDLNDKLTQYETSRSKYENAPAWFDYSWNDGGRYFTAVANDTSGVEALVKRSGKTKDELRQQAKERHEKKAIALIRKKAREAQERRDAKKKAEEAGGGLAAAVNDAASSQSGNDLKKQDDALKQLG